MKIKNWAIVTPMANEQEQFNEFVAAVSAVFDELNAGKLYFVVDNVSKDRTLELCKKKSQRDDRFVTVWAPENRNVVDAYIRGYKEAILNNHEYIIEMDAGMSHDPQSIKEFITYLEEGYPCVYGSRFIKGGAMNHSSLKRWFFSKIGTVLSNLLLGTRLKDMTSGYQAFNSETVKLFLNYPLKSKAHFYQTEIKYLLREKKFMEIPITYKVPSSNLRSEAVSNSIYTLLFYFKKRISLKPVSL